MIREGWILDAYVSGREMAVWIIDKQGSGSPVSAPISLFTTAISRSRRCTCWNRIAEITRATEIPIALEGIYRWVAFLPSRVDAEMSVVNRFHPICHHRRACRRTHRSRAGVRFSSWPGAV